MTEQAVPLTAMAAGLMACHSCRKLHRDNGKRAQYCQRCGDPLHYRAKKSLSRTWALCICAAIFMVLANIYPIMTVTYFGKDTHDTIMSGIISLVREGMAPIAAIVFVASIVVPLVKLVVLFWLLLSLQNNWKMNKRQCAQIFRILEFIGRWSMLDLFVIAILVTLVNVGNIANVTGGPAATYFATVVVLTMFAAHTFDPRLIWDLQDSTE